MSTNLNLFHVLNNAHQPILDELKPFMIALDIEFTDHTAEELVEQAERWVNIMQFMPDSSAANPADMTVDNPNLIAYLHYSIENTDYYITHRDRESRQGRAFGLIDPDGLRSPLDFIDLSEILRAGARFDLEWMPTPVAKIALKHCDF